MRGFYWILIVLTLLGLNKLVSMILDSGIMLPIMVIFLSLIILIEPSIKNRNAQRGNFLVVGSNKKPLTNRLLTVLIGCIFVVWGYLKTPAEISYLGFDFVFYTGILFLILNVINPDHQTLLFTKRFIKHKNLGFFGDRKYSKIDKIEIIEKSLKIYYNSELVVYDFRDSDEKVAIVDFLKPKIGDKLILMD